MQSKTGGIYIRNNACRTKPEQNTPDFIDITGSEPAPIVVFKQEAQSFVPETLNQG